MANELSLNVADVTKQIADRIKADFVALIPPEAWRRLVKEEIHRFVTDTNNYGHKEPAPLRQLIRRELEECFKAQIKEEVQKPEYMDRWDGGRNRSTPSEAVREIIKGLLPEIIQEMMAGYVEAVVTRLKDGRF